MIDHAISNCLATATRCKSDSRVDELAALGRDVDGRTTVGIVEAQATGVETVASGGSATASSGPSWETLVSATAAVEFI